MRCASATESDPPDSATTTRVLLRARSYRRMVSRTTSSTGFMMVWWVRYVRWGRWGLVSLGSQVDWSVCSRIDSSRSATFQVPDRPDPPDLPDLPHLPDLPTHLPHPTYPARLTIPGQRCRRADS